MAQENALQRLMARLLPPEARQIAKAATTLAKHKWDRDTDLIGRGVDWTRDMLAEVPNVTLPKVGSALDQLVSGFTGSEATAFPGQDSGKLGQAAWGAGLAAGMLTPDPSDVARVGRGLYSRLDDAVKLVPKGGAHPNKVLGLLKNNASGEELAYRGVPEWLQAQGEVKVTPEMLQGHLAARPAPMPEKKVLTAQRPKRLAEVDARIVEIGRHPDRFTDPALMAEREALAQEYGQLAGESDKLQPKHALYQVPGGTNYRETLSVMPEKPVSEAELTEWFTKRFGEKPGPYALDPTVEEGQSVRRAFAENQNRRYVHPHFPDTPNILVHSRSNQRTLPTGERGTLIENVQSDLHQEGRKGGYVPSEAEVEAGIARMRPLIAERDTFPKGSPEWQKREDEVTKIAKVISNMPGRVPDAPFKDSWPNLGLKQEILDAVERGDEWIGITPASILNTRGEAISEAFQDQRLPLTLEKILAPFGGGKVERGAVNARHTWRDRRLGFSPGTADAFLTRLTPEMRAQIKQKGLPLLLALLATQMNPVASHDQNR